MLRVLKGNIFFVILLAGVFYQCAQPVAEKQLPNIVLVIADDLGWMDVGYNGQKFYETPHIDQLAREGMIFDRFYPSAANCAPSRASIVTGTYSPRHHVYLPNGYARGNVDKHRFKVPTNGEDSTQFTFQVNVNHVDPAFMSLAELLKQKGYITARLGKWHIGDDNQGFDSLSSSGYFGDISNVGGEEGRYYNDTAVARRLTDAAVTFIEKHQNQPFFVYLTHWEVHTPMSARNDRISYYEEKLKQFPGEKYVPVYAAEVEQVDRSVGRVMQKLKDLNIDKNTLFIFTSDNGGLVRLTDNSPLRAGKGTFYEGGIRVPMCARWPDVIPPGIRTDHHAMGIDFMPTFSEITGAPGPTNQPIDGISFASVLQGEKSEIQRDQYFHFPLYLEGSGEKEQVLPVYGTEDGFWRAVPSTTLIRGDWKLIYYYEYETYELFNLGSDLSETKDVAKENPELVREMLKSIAEWTDEVNAPIPNVINDKFAGTDL
ncbi:MAG: sulfatase [Bacteroidota bacterium]